MSFAHTFGALVLVVACGPVPEGESTKISAVPIDQVEAPMPPRLPLATRGRFIVDAKGQRFKLASINWYGASDTKLVVGGLDQAPLDAIVAAIKRMGFNSVRLPFSNEMLHVQAPIDWRHVSANPQLFGLTPVAVLDAVIEALGKAGILVILNNHTTHAMWCCNYDDDGLWYTRDYSEERWVADWVILARRYAGHKHVVGADLRNEVRLAKWQGTLLPNVPHWAAQPNDWRRAAERAGAAILEANPNLLIVVEGLNAPRYHLRGVSHDPVRLPIGNRLVYAAHNYAFTRPGTLIGPPYGDLPWPRFKEVLDQEFGYVTEEARAVTAPVWVSEFGLGPTTQHHEWFANITRYLKERDLDWAVWALNTGPKASGELEDFGFLESDWQTPVQDFRIKILGELMPGRLGPGVDPLWGREASHALEVLPFSDGDTDLRTMPDDWAFKSYKATCREGSRLLGFSQGRTALGRYQHAALCSDYGLRAPHVSGIALASDHGDSPWSGVHTGGRDWDHGHTKLECPSGHAMAGLAQQKGGLGYGVSAVLCRPGVPMDGESQCSKIVTGRSDARRSLDGGDWDAGLAKFQCGAREFVAGLSLRKGKVASLLCCSLSERQLNSVP